MDIEVLSFRPATGDKNRGYVVISCNAFKLNLRIRQFQQENLYVEMPKLKIANEEISPILISKQEDHKYFQKTVLEQIETKYPGQLTLKKLVEENK